MPAWPDVQDVVDAAKLPPTAAEDPALADALAAAQAECMRLAPRRFDPEIGPRTEDAWWAVCKATALEYRGRGADYGVGYPDTAAAGEPGGDGWQGVRRLLGIGFYAPPRAR